MAKSPDSKMETDSPETTQTATAPPVGGDVESHTTTPEVDAGVARDIESHTTGEGSAVPKIVERWRKNDLLKKWSLGLHVSSFIFSFLAFIIMANNKHGDWRDFGKYEEFKYVLGIAVISTLYTTLQAFFQFYELSSGKELISRRPKMFLDFIGDQLLAYLLLSAGSSAVPLTNRMEEATDNIFIERKDSTFVDSSAAAISMEFFAFFALALAALISGYKLCNHS